MGEGWGAFGPPSEERIAEFLAALSPIVAGIRAQSALVGSGGAPMRSSTLLYCCRCVAVTHHATQGRYDVWGKLTGTLDKCLRCGHESAQGDMAGHEQPAGDPPPVTAGLSAREIRWLQYHQWRYAHGLLTEELPAPGVWG